LPEIVINSVEIKPNVVFTGSQFIISVDIFVLYPSNTLYPSEDLYPIPDTGGIRPGKYIIYPADNVYTADGLYSKP
jgi:hypothetical protein